MEGGRCQVEGPVQPPKSTSSVREESQDVGCDTQPAIAGLFFRGSENRGVILSYLHFAVYVKFAFTRHDWLVALRPRRHSSS